ncbi:MAG: ATP-binding cassette domain-containing protein, partial [Spirochaetales bacterium]|nr:ATP-binding cassette domain-containing protein [Spirochaetales bacterium]
IELLLRPTLLIMQGVPPILWSIPLILILGFSRLAPITVISLICFPLVATNISEGMQTIPPELKEMLAVYAPGFKARFRELILPHLKPFLAASIRLGLGIGIKASVIAEYFAANDGIGFQIQTAYQAFLIRKLFSWALVLILVILLFDFALRRLSLLIRRKPTALSAVSATELGKPESLLSGRPANVPGEIVIRDISFGYGHSAPLFQGVNVEVGPEEMMVISGDSGTGKTSLLKVIAGLVPPSGGSVSGPDLVGFMFQDDRFLPWFDNMRNVGLPLLYQGRSRRESEMQAGLLLEQVGLEDWKRSYPAELSGGMKKRLAFARSFACMPGALLLDEPFTGLHHDARAKLWALFGDLIQQKPVPVIVVTHFPEEVPARPGTRFYTLSGKPAGLIPA